jgi:hypothetical protein
MACCRVYRRREIGETRSKGVRVSAIYDPIDTVQWMLDGVRSAVLTETTVTEAGRPKKKTKAQREADRLRYETLCEVLWNVTGRPEPLDELTERFLAA